MARNVQTQEELYIGLLDIILMFEKHFGKLIWTTERTKTLISEILDWLEQHSNELPIESKLIKTMSEISERHRDIIRQSKNQT